MLIITYQTNTEHPVVIFTMNPMRRTNLHSNVWSCHAFNVLHQLPSFCALCFAIIADEFVLLIFVLQTFSWNHSPIYFLLPSFFAWNNLKYLRYFML